jgi:predicted nucleotidyltransferase
MAGRLWKVDEERLNSALETVIERVQPIKIIAFGSRATNTAQPDSDLDLALLFDGPPSGPVSGRAWKTFSEFHIPVDLVNVSQAHHEKFSSSINGVHREIAEKGVTLYDVQSGSIDRTAVANVSR